MFFKKQTLLFVAGILLIIDQLIKYLIYKYQPQTISYNKGIFFGSLDNIYLLYFFILLGIFILIFLFIKSSKKYLLPLTIISVGALSNIIDRIFYPGVIDYINIGFWSIFNLSDIYIFIGALWYLIIMFTQQSD